MSDAVIKATEKLAASFEGLSYKPYQDQGGTWTIGYGTTIDAAGKPVTGTTPALTNVEALALLDRDIVRAVSAVVQLVKVKLSDNETEACADFVYNLGRGAFAGSTLLADLNKGNYAAAAAQFDRWDHIGSRVIAGLLRRRQAETDLFNTAPGLERP
jgi:lysozyme